MTNNFEKFVKNIIKNPDFLILKSEENLLMLGVKLKFVEYIVNDNNPFSPPVNLLYEREWPVVFLITSKSILSETERMFARKELPILNLSKEKNMSFTEKSINQRLEKFINENFRNDKNKYTVSY